MPSRVKIRGIFSTALTRLLLDAGYYIVDPSSKIKERFLLEPLGETYDIAIQDRLDLQGVDLMGAPENLCQFLTFLQERLLDVVLLGYGTATDGDSLVKATVEFPGLTKTTFDTLRHEVAPTVRRHHQLKIVNSKALERAEIRLTECPDEKDDIEKRLFTESVLLPLEKGGMVRMEHMRPSGKAMRPREGVLLSIDDSTLTFKRTFQKGRYDGLDIPITHGDYGVTEIREGEWFVKHSYFNCSGQLIGEYYNINTPVEIYPYGARYLDLEVDVVKRPGEAPFIIDQEKLALLARQGNIGTPLEQKALEIAHDLARDLAGH